MVATQAAASAASALAPQPMNAKMLTTPSNSDPAGSQDLAPSASESTTAIASDNQSDADANPSLIVSPDENRAAHERDTVAGADRDIIDRDESDTVVNSESSTAEEVAKEPSAGALPKAEDADQNNQDLQDDETLIKQSQAAKARSFLSVAGFLFIPNEMLTLT
jgi:hypothetical protein